MQQELPEGELIHELADPDTGEPLALIDLAWPNGLQESTCQSVALLLDGTVEAEAAMPRVGYQRFQIYFTTGQLASPCRGGRYTRISCPFNSPACSMAVATRPA